MNNICCALHGWQLVFHRPIIPDAEEFVTFEPPEGSSPSVA